MTGNRDTKVTGADTRAQRGPAFTHGTVTLLVLLVVAALALPTTQTPPPAIAEFSPQSQEQITEAPESQTSTAGEGAGGAGTGTGGSQELGPDGTPVTTVPPIQAPRTRRCVGNPPRQTEDPQSPPCVSFWEGDNGGSTWQGVTGDEIRIVVPQNGTHAQRLLAHFNRRYELYGRKLRVVEFDRSGDQVADAIQADEEAQAFASTLYGDAGGQEYVYYDELARRGIVSANGNPSMVDETHLARHHPYQWSYLPGHDTMSRNHAEWICKALNGRNASFAGSELILNRRQFGLVTTIGRNGASPDLKPMKAVLKACGASPIVEETIVMQNGDDAAGLAEARDIALKLKLDGVTTVICRCHTQSSGLYLYTAASAQDYFPEWLISTYMYQAEDVHVQFWDGAQVEHTFGLQWWSKQVPPEEAPWFWAVKEGDPDYEFANHFDYYDARWLYNSLLLLVSGIQMAGPELTPDTFARGLQATRFPNPSPGGPPYWQGKVGFAGDHSMVDDAAVIWADKNAPSSWGRVPGAICYADRGRRYSLGSWPMDTAGLFTGPCY